jgi:manganese transport protein
LAAGQIATITCTQAGQLMMERFLRIRLSPLGPPDDHPNRRSRAGKALLYPGGQGRQLQLQILSQVVLSLQLAFAIIPLVAFAGNRRLMGPFVLGPMATACGWTMAMLVLAFKAVLIWQMAA